MKWRRIMSPSFLKWTSKVNKKEEKIVLKLLLGVVMCENTVCLQKAQPSGSTSVLFWDIHKQSALHRLVMFQQKGWMVEWAQKLKPSSPSRHIMCWQGRFSKLTVLPVLWIITCVQINGSLPLSYSLDKWHVLLNKNQPVDEYLSTADRGISSKFIFLSDQVHLAGENTVWLTKDKSPT